jgi:peptide/nickel transport system substrate-binding protein
MTISSCTRIVALAVVSCSVLATAPPAHAVPLRSGQAASTAVHEGGSIVYGLEAETGGGWCLPRAQLATSGTEVVAAIYDTLVVPNAQGRMVPYLAQRVEHDSSFTVWTIVLRDGVTFHDGSPLTAAAVKQNIDAWRAGPIFGFAYSDIADTRVVDPLTVQVTTKEPWVDFDSFLYEDGRVGIAAPAQLDDQANCATHLIGTGPFELDHWTPNLELVVVKNPHYWRKDDRGRSLPYLDKITFRPVTETTQRVAALQAGNLDAVYVSSPTALDQLRGTGRFQYLREPVGRRPVRYFLLNTKVPPFSDLTARRAAAFAIDRVQLNQIHNDGRLTVASGPFDRDVIGYLRDPGFPAHDLQRARSLVRAYKAAHGGEFSAVLETDTDLQNQAEAQLVQGQLERAGIHVTIDVGDDTGFVRAALSGAFGILQVANHQGDDPDQNYGWWSSTSPANFGHFDDPTLEGLLRQGRSETDPTVRRKIYEQVNRRFARQLYDLWAYYYSSTIAARSNVLGLGGVRLPDGGGMPLFINVHPVVGIHLR